MTIRFLQTVPSENPEFPFQAGQVISLPVLPSYLRDHIKAGRAVLVTEDRIERAITPDPEYAEPVRVRGRRK
jgi:hypothetical protein